MVGLASTMALMASASLLKFYLLLEFAPEAKNIFPSDPAVE
jgi:hypothetical protein